jgi:hypothetical protein
VRTLASTINDGTPIREALADYGVELGEISVQLSPESYLELRRRASLENRDPGDVVDEALRAYFEDAGQ